MASLAVGEPSWSINADGGWDFVPIVIACATLLVLKVIFRVTLRWYVVAAVVLVAPLFRALADDVGMPPAIAMTLIFVAVAIFATRRSATPGRPSDV
jgi:hypothetical protein